MNLLWYPLLNKWSNQPSSLAREILPAHHPNINASVPYLGILEMAAVLM